MTAPAVKVETFYFDLPLKRWRVMFHDGSIIDVVTRCSDSRLNDFAFQTHYGHKPSTKTKDVKDEGRIVGMTDLGEEAPA